MMNSGSDFASREPKNYKLRRSVRILSKPKPNYKCDSSSSFKESSEKEQLRPTKKQTVDNNLPDLRSVSRAYASRGDVPRAIPDVLGLVCKDISCGNEVICISAINTCDDPPLAPEGFTYIKSLQVGENVTIPPDAPGCSCKGRCTDPRTCSCAQLNGSCFPYVSDFGGRMTKARDIVYECGPSCECGPKCYNRSSQKGIKYRLEVYKTPHKGWAVRSRDLIPSGVPVVEYIGIIRRNTDLKDESENDYIFNIDCWHTMNGIGGRKRRSCHAPIPSTDNQIKSETRTPSSEKMKLNVPIMTSSSDAEKQSEAPTPNNEKKPDEEISDHDPVFCIDAASFGNVARFINHSCDPNLFVQCVLSSHHDIHLARVVLFASHDIRPMQELTYDYGYELNSVVGPNGKIKELPCYCGANICRKRLY